MNDRANGGNGGNGEHGVGLSSAAKRVAKILVFALVIHLFVLPQLGGARSALTTIGSVNPIMITAALGLEVAALLAYARLTLLLLPSEQRPGLGTAFGAVLASTGVSHVVPGGAATTAAVNLRMLGNAGVPRETLGFALGTQAIGSAVVLNLMLWVALVVSIPTGGFHLIYASAAAIGALLIAAFGSAVVAIRRGRDRFADRVAAVVGHLPRVHAARVRSIMIDTAEQLDSLLEDRRRLRQVLVLAAANWLLDAGALYVMVSAFGPRPSVDGLMVAYGLANVMAAVPISPGGLGVVEAILIPSLVGFGTPASQASIGVVAYRLVNFWLPIPAGAVAYVLAERGRGRRGGYRSEINRRIEASKKPSTG